MQLHVIYTKSEMLLSKKHYGSWREIQDEYEDYKTSFGPWAKEEVLEFIEEEYPEMDPRPSIQIDSLIHSGKECHVFTFKPRV